MHTLMRVLSLATGLVVLGSAHTHGANTAADEAALKGDPAAWFKAYNAGDAQAVANLYAEDGVVMAPGAPAAVGRAAIRDFIAAEIKSTKAAGLTFKGFEVTGVGVSGDTGWLSGTYTMADSKGAVADKGKFLSIYRRTNGTWKLIRDTWNSDMPPEKK